jgi:2-polyprenyl-6-methoxyphenol hydroxylase-like FAD-dependent oxidoreductase
VTDTGRARGRHALVIGGGIAGPTAAMALQRAGIEATVFEAYPADAAPAAAFLTVAVNGLAALGAIGLDRPVMAAGFPTDRIRFASGSGKALGELPIGGRLADGTVAHTIRRTDLHRVLYTEARRRGIQVVHGTRLVDATPTADGGVVARFEDGSTAEGDLLIGADGLHSRTRRIIDPAAPAPRYTGLGNVGGFGQADVPAIGSGTYVMTFGRRAFFGWVRSPDGEVWWFANPPRAAELTRDELAAPGASWREQLAALFAEDAGPAVDIVRSTREIMATNQHDLPRVPRWWRGPMVIIGDAAHATSPTSGQGASLAIEDALVLARCVRDLRHATAAFAEFERLRRPRVERVIAWAARMNRNKMPGPIARAVRDVVLPLVLRRAGRRSQGWLFEHRIEW